MVNPRLLKMAGVNPPPPWLVLTCRVTHNARRKHTERSLLPFTGGQLATAHRTGKTLTSPVALRQILHTHRRTTRRSIHTPRRFQRCETTFADRLAKTRSVGHRRLVLTVSVRPLFRVTRRWSLSSVLEPSCEPRDDSKSPAQETVDQHTSYASSHHGLHRPLVAISGFSGRQPVRRSGLRYRHPRESLLRSRFRRARAGFRGFSEELST